MAYKLKHKVFSPANPSQPFELQGIVVATYNQLRQAFSEPSLGEPGYPHLWRFDVDGIQCTIYDGPEDLNTGNSETWYVGGQSADCERLVNEALAERPADPIQVIEPPYDGPLAISDVDNAVIPLDQ